MSQALRCDLLSPEDVRWSSLLERVTYDFYHLPAYVHMCAHMEKGEAAAFYVAEGRNEFLLPLILRPLPELGLESAREWRDAVSPYGYPGAIIATENPGSVERAAFVQKALSAFLVLMRERRILSAFVRLHPLLDVPEQPFAALGRLVLHGDTVSIDLTQSATEIWAGVRANHRRQIRSLEQRHGVRTEEDSQWIRLSDFIATYRATMDRVQASSSYYFDASYFRALRDALGDRVHLMLALFGEQVAAGVVFTECCGFVQYHLAATAPEFFKERPQKILCRDTWQWAQRRGGRVFHLGGGVGGKEDGLFHFKAGFSDRRHPFYTWRACCEPKQYDRLVAACLVQNPAGSADTEFFPAYRQPSLAPGEALR